MKLSILTAAIILLCPFACIAHDTAKSSSSLQITKKSENKCLIPGYKVIYKSTINGHDLGVITRIVKEKSEPHYKITSQLKIDKFIFS